MTEESTVQERQAVHEVARRARVAAADLRQLTRNEKDSALRALADALVARTPEIVAANAISEPENGVYRTWIATEVRATKFE